MPQSWSPAGSSKIWRTCQWPGRWEVRQIFDDPAGDHDWGLSARVDLAASDEAGEAVLAVTDVGQLSGF